MLPLYQILIMPIDDLVSAPNPPYTKAPKTVYETR